MSSAVTFQKLIQDSQTFGSDDAHMVSRIFFTLEIDGNTFPDLYADIKQTVGTDYETASLEVGAPHGYTGAFNHEVFSPAAERYYRDSIGSHGRMIRISEGSNVRMMNNTFVMPRRVEFP